MITELSTSCLLYMFMLKRETAHVSEFENKIRELRKVFGSIGEHSESELVIFCGRHEIFEALDDMPRTIKREYIDDDWVMIRQEHLVQLGEDFVDRCLSPFMTKKEYAIMKKILM